MAATSVPLTPLAFLRRAMATRPNAVAVQLVNGPDVTYAELGHRADRLSDALRADGVGPGDHVAVLAPNGLVMLEAHFGVPGSGAALVALNTRLGIDEYAYILDHSRARVLIVDAALVAAVEPVLGARTHLAKVVVLDGTATSEYDTWLADAPPSGGMQNPTDELQPIAVNYTSGTTGRPKGVVYTHRGAFLNALGSLMSFGVGPDTVYLWTLPMFHCNGWCLVWGVTAAGGTHVCLPKPDPDAAIEAIGRHRVTHLCAAPVVLSALVAQVGAQGVVFDSPVRVAVGGAPPSPATIMRAEQAGMLVVHLYGMTETYGPSLVCVPMPDWDALPFDERARLMSRQGVPTVVVDAVRVLDESGVDVPADGSTMGEIVVRSATVMAGYLDDPEATAQVLRPEGLHTGDLAVMHADGYIEIRDRAKDIIISGGENISSVEVEHVLASHPLVVEVAVVARLDDHWGEVPVAFVKVQPGAIVAPDELIDLVRSRLAHFKAPKEVVFTELPKTATGKIRKGELRILAARRGPPDEES
jgi:fatty-acyl-CoA synthase